MKPTLNRNPERPARRHAVSGAARAFRRVAFVAVTMAALSWDGAALAQSTGYVGNLRSVGSIGTGASQNVGHVGTARTSSQFTTGIPGGGGGGPGWSNSVSNSSKFTQSTALVGRRVPGAPTGTLKLSGFQMSGSVSNRLVVNALTSEAIEPPQLPGGDSGGNVYLGLTSFDRSFRFSRAVDTTGYAFLQKPYIPMPGLPEQEDAEDVPYFGSIGTPEETATAASMDGVDLRALARRGAEDYFLRAIDYGFVKDEPKKALLAFDSYRRMVPEDPRGFVGTTLISLTLDNRYSAIEAWSQAMKRFAESNGVLENLWFDFDQLSVTPDAARTGAKKLCESLRKTLETFDTGGARSGSRVMALSAWVSWQTGDFRSALEKCRRAAADEASKPVANRLPGIPLLLQRMQQAKPDITAGDAEPLG